MNPGNGIETLHECDFIEQTITVSYLWIPETVLKRDQKQKCDLERQVSYLWIPETGLKRKVTPGL